MKNLRKIVIFTCILVMIISINNYAQSIRGEDIWMGFATNEFGGMSYGAVANNDDDTRLKVAGYGRYQFMYNTNLIDFLTYSDSNYFKKWIEYGKGSLRLNNFDSGLPQAFTDYYTEKGDEFKEKQDNYIYEKFFIPICNYYKASDIDLHELTEFEKGAILSIVIHRYWNNEINQNITKNSIIDLINLYDTNDKEHIKKLYDLVLSKYHDEKSQKRWTKEKMACLDEVSDEFDSHIGELLNKYGKANSATFIRDLNNLNPTIFSEFLTNKKFTKEDTLEWYDAVRTSVDFNREFNISSGVLDFSTSTSHGINMDGYLELIENEVAFNIPNNDTNIYYIPQNTNKKTYSEEKFGSNNVAQGGASLCCMAMAINKLWNRNQSNLILPDNILEKLLDEYGTVNYFYDIEKSGQKNEIIDAICALYGLSSNIISKESVISSLQNNHMVIARVGKSEFTNYGTFILLCGVQNHNDKNYVIVADPNIYHTRFLYNLYDIDYIAKDLKGIFFDIHS